MSPPTLDSFLSTHGVKVGDRVAVHWKNTRVEGIILPHSHGSTTLTLKMSSGYNTGLALSHITQVEKLPSPPQNGSISLSPQRIIHPADDTKPAISLIGVGGTIASKVNYDGGGVNAKLGPLELSEIIPEANSFAQIKYAVSPFMKMSEDNDPSDWQEMAKVVHAEINKPDVAGVILTHGTDTLHYTAAALSFMLPNLSKPLVLVGSQRSSDRGSSDAPMNLLCAVHAAVSNIAEVGICMHGTTSDDYCLFIRGSSVRKMHTSRRDAFRPINRQPLARVWPDGKIDPLSDFKARTNDAVGLDTGFESNIALVKMHPGFNPEVLHYYVSKGCKGFVLEGTGLGHVHANVVPVIRSIVEKGIPVFITPQTIYGRVNLSVYTNLRIIQEAGAIGLEDMISEVAYVKLGWVLAHTKDFAKVKEMMLTNYAGEITPASHVNGFLV